MQSTQCIRKCCMPTFGYTLVLQIDRFVRLIGAVPQPQVSSFGTPKFCVAFCYSGGTFLRSLEGICLPIVELPVRFCFTCLCSKVFG